MARARSRRSPKFRVWKASRSRCKTFLSIVCRDSRAANQPTSAAANSNRQASDPSSLTASKRTALDSAGASSAQDKVASTNLNRRLIAAALKSGAAFFVHDLLSALEG